MRSRLLPSQAQQPMRQPTGTLLAHASPSQKFALTLLPPHLLSKPATWRPKDAPVKGRGTIAVVCAGTSDIPVAEEAAVTSEIMGNRVERVYDVGVAGLHRLLGHHRQLTEAALLIVVAGMGLYLR